MTPSAEQSGPVVYPDDAMGHHSQFNGIQARVLCYPLPQCGQGPFSSVALGYWTRDAPDTKKPAF